MTERHQNLHQLCIPAKQVREMWYGDVYSARVTHEGLVKNCDVVHIQIPLSDRKLSEAIKLFNLQQEDKEDFFGWLWERVQNHVKTLSQLKAQGVRNIVDLWFADTFEENGKRDIYILTAPYRPYAELIEETQLVIKDVYGLAVRLGNIIRGLNSAGYVHGDISLSSIYCSEDNQLVLNDFYYTALMGTEPDPNRYKYILPAHIPEEIAVNGQVNDCTDVYALCSLMWHIASEIPADIRTPYLTNIPKAPEEFTEMLYRVMSTADLPMELYRKQASKLLANASKNLEVYSSLSFYVPQCREKYEPVPADAEAPETEPTEGELLDAIAPIPEREVAEAERVIEQEQSQESEQITEIAERPEGPETSEQMQQETEPQEFFEKGSDFDKDQPVANEADSSKSEAEFEEVSL